MTDEKKDEPTRKEAGSYTSPLEEAGPSGSFTGTHEDDVEYDGAFTDSEIPAEDVKPGETEVDKAGFEGSYTDTE